MLKKVIGGRKGRYLRQVENLLLPGHSGRRINVQLRAPSHMLCLVAGYTCSVSSYLQNAYKFQLSCFLSPKKYSQIARPARLPN